MTIGPYQRHLHEFPNGNLGPAITLDFHANGTYQSGVLNNANCILTFLPPRVHSTIWLEFIQDATGGRTVTFPVAVIGPSPAINLAANASTIIEMLWNGVNYQFTSPSAIGFINVSAGSTSNNLPAVIFSNSNGLSFGLSGSVITGSYTAPSIGINISAGTTSSNLSSIVFSNSNNLSFGLSGSTITGSIPQISSLSATGVLSISSNGNTISIGVPAQLVNISAGTISNNLTNFVFSNSNGLSFGLSGSTVTGSVAAAVGQTNQTIGLYGLGNTTQNSSTTLDARTLSFNGLGGNTVGYSNGSIQISGVTTAGLISRINVSAGTTSNNLSAITFSNSNGMSFGLNGSTITGSYTIPSTAGLLSAVNISAGTTSSNISNFVFSNSNGVSFGLSGSTITGSVSAAAQTLGFYAIGNTTQNSSTTLDGRTLSFNALGAMTMGYSNGSIQASAPTLSSLSATGIISISSNGSTISIGAPIQSINVSAGTTSNNLTNFVLSNSNGISFGLSGSTLTASVAAAGQTNQTIGLYALGNTTQNSSTTLDARTLSFNGLGNITVGYSNGSIQISGSGAGSVKFSAGTTSNNLTAITFSNSNNVSFGLNGSTITASAAVGSVNISAGTTSNNLTNFVFSNSNGMSFGLNGSTITGSVAAQTANIAVPSAGTQTATSGTVVYSNSNNITFGMSGSSRITASYNFSISGGTSSNFGNGITFTNSNNMSFTNNAGVIAAKAAPKTSEVVNDSTVPGTTGADALNNLLIEFPFGQASLSSTSITINTGYIGTLILLTGIGVTITVPTLSASGINVGSRFSFMLYGPIVYMASIVASGGVTLHLPTVFPGGFGTRFDFECIAVNEWVVTYKQAAGDTDGIINTSNVSGILLTAALNSLKNIILGFQSVAVITATTPTNWDYVALPNYGWYGRGLGGAIWGVIPSLPEGSTLLGVSILLRPNNSHIALPTVVPRFRVYASSVALGVTLIISQSDTSPNFTAYNLPHTISGTVSAPNGVTAGAAFTWELIDESGTGSFNLLNIINIEIQLG